MKNIQRPFGTHLKAFGLSLAFLFISLAGVAQIPTSVDIGIYEATPGTLEIRMTPNGSSFDQLVSSISFTLKWETASGLTLGTVNQQINGDLCPLLTTGLSANPAGVVTNAQFSYMNYNVISTTQLQNCATSPGYSWAGDTEVVLAEIPYTGASGCLDLNIANDAFTTSSNYDFFVSLNAVNKTGAIISPNLFSQGASCDDGDPATGNDALDASCNCVGQLIDCEGTAGGTALPGATCDDGDATTGSDVYDANCNCSGQLIDCLGVAGGTDLPGASCNDGNPNTTGDVYDANCNCAGLLVDCEGTAGGSALPGTSCDDGDATTGNDIYDNNCNCAGQLIDCTGVAGGSNLPGATCDDGDATTGNDVYDTNCNCAGQLIDCEGLAGGTSLAGTSCDDGDATTGNDVYDANCNCAGQLIDCEGLAGGTALPGTSCDDGDATTGNDIYDNNCNCAGQLIDCTGIAGGSALPGATCDDADATTGNDVYDANCNCVGQLIDCEGIAGGIDLPGASCDDGDATTGNDVYDANCNCAGQLIDCEGLAGGTALPSTPCDDGDPNTGGDVYQADCSCAGALIDCLGVVGGTDVPGAACDDGDASTGNDVYNANCNCVGQLIDCLGVAGGTALPGASCDDGDASTGNDIYDSNCNCAGQLIDCEGVPGGTNLPGSVCDDNDSTTGNDVYDANCNCAGQLIDCLGLAGGSTFPGTSCDDGNASTGSDVYDANCNCAGQLIDCLGVIGGSDLPGTSCDDGDATTGNDVYDANCNCAGSLIDCEGTPGGTVFAGSPCDDGDATTGNDVYDTNCNCAGQLIDCEGLAGGTALPNTSCDDGDATTGNDVYDANCNCAGQLIDCVGVVGGSTLPGSTCDDGDATTGNDIYDANCNCTGLPLDCAGTPGGSALPGTTCDDNDPLTFNDVYDANCGCAGVLCDPNDPAQDCDYDGIANGIDCDPADASINYGVGSSCDDGDPTTAGDIYDANCNCVGQIANCSYGMYMEAECAIVGSNWISDVNTSSSSGLGVSADISLSNQYTVAPTAAADRVRFEFNLGIGGMFHLWSRMISWDANPNSFWVRANGGAWINYNNIPGNGVLTWDDLHDSDNGGTEVLLPLVAGLNTIDFAYREPGVVLDKIFITCGSTTPSGLGGTATNCPDADNDGIFDFVDIDDDNDGLLDTEEGLNDNCIALPAIEGATCAACNPTGWSLPSGADLITGNGPWPGGGTFVISDISGPSPSGGNMVMLASSATTADQFGTILTGLNVGQSYTFSLEFEQAYVTNGDGSWIGAGGDLQVIVAGNTTVFTPVGTAGGDTWQTVNVSFVASAASENVVAGLVAGSSALDHGILVVDAGSPCSTLTTVDTDGDGLADHLDIDSDNDGCNDVLEAGFTDANNDGELDGTGYASNGTVAGATDGYTGTDPAVTDFVCTINLDCEGVPNGTALPGTSCDDGDVNTGNDVYDANCNCAGQLIDCEGLAGGTALPGTTCDDGDATTGNDVYDANCNCAGQLIDCEGLAGGTALPGTSCDDGDANTGNDVYDANCNCAGQLIDCEGLAGGTALPGTSCDDGDANTGNDVYDANCNCAGQLIDCEGLAGGTALPGTSCDDGDANTTNDVYDANCNCAGQLFDCEGVAGGTALPGTSCDDGDATTGNDVYDTNCNCAGQLIDCEGVAGGTALPGSACDDQNPLTGNDAYDANCVCRGQLLDCEGVAGGTALPGTPCDDADPNTGNDKWDTNCNCFGLPLDCEGIAGGTALPGTACDDGDAGTINDLYQSDCSCVGTVTNVDCEGVAGGTALPGTACDDGDFTTGNDTWDANCNCAGLLIDCFGVAGGLNYPGASCDDGNPGTINDTWTTDCNCFGTPADCEGVPNGPAMPGTLCDDGDPLTLGTTWDASCNCSGGFVVDCEGVTGGSALPGTSCDDGNVLTSNDVYDANCNCTGTAVDCEGVAGGTALPGTACDDGDAATTNDVYDANCNCTGTTNGPITVCFDLGTSADPDREESDQGSVYQDAGNLDLILDSELPYQWRGEQHVGLLYENVNVPQGASVINAYIQFTAADTLNYNPIQLNITAEASDDAPLLSYPMNNISGRTPTSASVTWAPNNWSVLDESGLDQRTPNLALILQELVDRPGWAANNSMALLIDGFGGRSAYSSNQDIAKAAVLCVTYSTTVLPPDCEGIAGGSALPGAACNDADASTVNDTYDANCNCIGEQLDCAGVANGTALPGTSCDDGDATTGNDVYDSSCNCAGQLIDCNGVVGGNALPGSACDDGDASTNNDVLDANCNCAGTANTQTICFNLGTSADPDREESTGGGVYEDVGALDLVLDSDLPYQWRGDQFIGLHFEDLTIPQGASILNAYIQFTANDTMNYNPIQLNIAAEASDNAPLLSYPMNNISSRTATGANVQWSPADWNVIDAAGLDQRTPNLAAILQEVVNRPGWASNNSMAFLIDGFGGRQAYSSNQDPTKAAVLCVTFTTQQLPLDCEGIAGGLAGPGTPCDDGNIFTINDTYNANCNCVGDQVDCAGVINGSALPGTTCDDGDATTGNDVYDSNCNCAGLVIDCAGVPGGTSVLDDCGVCNGNNDCLGDLTCYDLGAGDSDREEAENGGVYENSGALDLVLDSELPYQWRGNQVVGLRFEALNIPAGAIITAANIQFTANDTMNYNPCNISIAAEAADDAPVLSWPMNGISSRVLTSNSVAWSPADWTVIDEAGSDQRTPDMATVLQEIVDRPGWADGNAMVFVIEGVGGRQAYSSNQDASKGAKLCLSWEMPTAFHNGGNAGERITDQDALSAMLYPNPNRGDVLFMDLSNDLQEESAAKIIITDLYGKEIYEKDILVSAGFHHEILELRGTMAQGVYLVNVLIDGRMLTERLVIQ